MEVWKIIFLCKWVICRFHVNLPQGEFMVAFAWNTVIHEVLLDGWSHATCWHALAARYHFVCCLGWFCATTETWKILKDLSILVYFFEMDNQFESISCLCETTQVVGLILAKQIGGCQIFSRMTGWLFQFVSWLYPKPIFVFVQGDCLLSTMVSQN